MKVKIGIPRGLFFFQYYPLWKVFLEELGLEVIVSDKTNKKIMNEGVERCVDGACLPVKVFHGHVENLIDRVDCLFIPRFTSVTRKEYVCPKFGGLPDMIRNSFTGLPEIIDTEVNLRESKKNAIKSAIEIGEYFTRDKEKIRKAYEKALGVYRQFRMGLKADSAPDEIWENCDDCIAKCKMKCEIQRNESGTAIRTGMENNAETWPGIKSNRGITSNTGMQPGRNVPRILLIGHCYNLYDRYVNMNIIGKLKKLGTEIITIDMINGQVICEKSALLHKRMFWFFGTKAMGTVFHVLDRNDISGIIYVMSFGCGIDSFVCDLAERIIRRNKDIPFIVLTIDEHSGEAGLNTRLEAFVDMIKWRNVNEGNFSAYGESVYLH